MINLYNYYSNPSELDHQEKYQNAINNVISDVHVGWHYSYDWMVLKHVIKKIPLYAQYYAKNTIKGRWLEAEPYILKGGSNIYSYALDVIKGRWPEGEAELLQARIEDGKYMLYMYARYVIKDEWPEAEKVILTDCEATYHYTAYVLKRRWPEGEKAMLETYTDRDNDCYYLSEYAKCFMKERWLEAEPLIKQLAPIWSDYCEIFNILPD